MVLSVSPPLPGRGVEGMVGRLKECETTFAFIDVVLIRFYSDSFINYSSLHSFFAERWDTPQLLFYFYILDVDSNLYDCHNCINTTISHSIFFSIIFLIYNTYRFTKYIKQQIIIVTYKTLIRTLLFRFFIILTKV